MENNIKSFVMFIIKHPCVTIAAFCFTAISITSYDVMTGAKVVKLFLSMIGAGAIMDMIIEHFLPMDDNDEGDDLF